MTALTHVPTPNHPPVMETLSGHLMRFDRLDHIATPVEEFALVLTRLPSMNGHQIGLDPYTIAHHSLWVMRYVLWSTGCPKSALYALIHRAHAAYMGAIPQQVKQLSFLYAPLDHLETKIQQMVHENVGLPEPDSARTQIIEKAIEYADTLEQERFSAVPEPCTKIPEAAREMRWDHCTADAAYHHFLEAFNVLSRAVEELECES